MSLIKCTDLCMGYEGKRIIENLSFTVDKGSYLCIVGENGSGKTTLMKGLLGLIEPSSGKIEYLDGLKQRYIGYLPQQNNIKKDFPSSVFEVVLSGTLNQRIIPFYSKSQKTFAIENMKLVGIDHLKKKSFQQLSGGQQQRVLLARALCATSKLLILDEPITGLDPIASQDFYQLVTQLNKSGITIIMVSHDITESLKHASHILHLTEDSFYFGTTHQYIHSDIGNKFLLKDCPCDSCQHNHQGGSL